MATFPLTFSLPNWFTTRFIAARLGVSHRTVQHWCKTGFLQRRGCTVITAIRLNGLYRCWVRVPNLSTDARLRKLAIDTLPTLTVGSKVDERSIPSR